MRVFLVALVLGTVGAALLPSHQANAWWDRWGGWHPGYVGPRVAVVPPPVYAPPYYARPPVYYATPYARWIPPHYNRWGRFVPGHWG
jgi:hypothetical protein